ncbi:MAG: cytidylate kinase-like family protein [Lachnospiraceae bacterium]|nr:cytidylate kinase-like family protein [Lachnospiraceae bacterium]
MSENKTLPVITVSRQYGAGGHSVAKGLSERLGLQYYDYDFVRLTAKVSGYTEEEVKREGEDLGRGSKFVNSFLTTASFSNPYNEIFQAEKAVILGLAEKPCILVGRCSNVILQEAGIPSLNVFLSASKEFRRKRAVELGDYGSMDPDKYVERRDHWRDTYYRAYTGHQLGLAEDYHLCLDVSRFGVEHCVEIIAALAEKF